MIKLIFLAAFAFCLTISCSTPKQSDNSDSAINQNVPIAIGIANDSSATLKNKI